MTLAAPSFEVFETDLHTLQTALQDFLKALEEEKHILEKNKLDILETMIAKKQLIVNKIQHFFETYQSFFKNQQLSDNAVIAFIYQYPSHKSATIMSLWTKIKALLHTCELKNLANGIIITTMKNHNDALLQIVTQRPAQMVYSNLSKKFTTSVSTREHKA